MQTHTRTNTYVKYTCTLQLVFSFRQNNLWCPLWLSYIKIIRLFSNQSNSKKLWITEDLKIQLKLWSQKLKIYVKEYHSPLPSIDMADIFCFYRKVFTSEHNYLVILIYQTLFDKEISVFLRPKIGTVKNLYSGWRSRYWDYAVHIELIETVQGVSKII